MAELVELKILFASNKRTHSRSCKPYLYPHRLYNPTGGVRVFQGACHLLPSDVQIIFPNAESDLDALSAVDLEPQQPFSVGEGVVWEPRSRRQIWRGGSLPPGYSWQQS
jgi:hypothetical protein